MARLKHGSSVIAIAATLGLHAALLAAILVGTADTAKIRKPAEPLQVQLLQEPIVQPMPLPAPPVPVPAPIAVPEPAPKPPEARKPQESRPRSPAKPPERRAQAPKKPAVTPTPAPPPVPAASSTTATGPLSPPAPIAPPAPTASTAPVPAPSSAQATPAPPQRTSVSIATYAASNRKPPYPRLSRTNDEQGTVVLRVLVNADGTAGTVEVKASSGYPLLDESARTTVQTWRFNPATIDGKPIAEWYQVSIPFKLQDN